MSNYIKRRRWHRRTTNDSGMTLVELLVSSVVVAIIGAVVATAIITVFRQMGNTRGRTEVARSEQSISLWMPADLSSAETVDTAPQSTPCGATICGDINLSNGSNVLMLSWNTRNGSGIEYSQVSYNFFPEADGTYSLRRVKCTSPDNASWSCDSSTILRNLPGPPAGADFVPGVANGALCSAAVNPVLCTNPDWVITVSQPLAADAVNETQLETNADQKNANRVVVTINGGGSAQGAGGGINQISITAGGAVRSNIDAKSLQGAPSFSDVRSRCGGNITVVVDESNSIGSSITQVRAGVKSFIQTLAGTPTKIQVVGFHTYSHVLGTTSWQKYFDMTKDSEVTALLTAVDTLAGSWATTPNGGTNWEEALFRTLKQADASTTAVVPKTVVFFTDGVPTFDRLVQRTSPGVLPADPAAPGAPWPTSNGTAYSQVAFDRARHIADEFRTSTRLIGVGVGTSIQNSSSWIVDPGAGYRTQWERGSYSYVRDTTAYQLRYQKQDASGSPYYWVNYNTYVATSSARRKDLGWTNVTLAEYLTVENPVNTSTTDGAKTVVVSTPVSTAEYTAYSADSSYRAVTKTYAAGPDWEVWTGSRTSGATTEYRSTKVYNSPPYEAYEPAVTATTANAVILARLIAGNDYGTPAVFDGTNYTNTQLADMYILPQWSQFVAAMQAVSVGQCGGTLTLQTKIGSTAVADPFRYQNSAVTDSSGTALNVEPRVVTTNQQFTTGTFDFTIPNGQYVDVDIVPQNYSDLSGYQPVAWACKAGITPVSHTSVAIPGQTKWSGIRVRVPANAAISCTLTVQRD